LISRIAGQSRMSVNYAIQQALVPDFSASPIDRFRHLAGSYEFIKSAYANIDVAGGFLSIVTTTGRWGESMDETSG
jgi:hypothetical protein